MNGRLIITQVAHRMLKLIGADSLILLVLNSLLSKVVEVNKIASSLNLKLRPY